jgi:small-conductance mechanosensitive channel
MHSCRSHLSAYQRRWMRTIEILMGICIALSIVLQAIMERHSPSMGTRYGIAVLSIAPVIATIMVVARYLRGENDEYLRNLVVESMLWGLGIVLIADTFFSYVQPYSSLIPFGNLSLDIFVVTASITLEVKLWGNR